MLRSERYSPVLLPAASMPSWTLYHTGDLGLVPGHARLCRSIVPFAGSQGGITTEGLTFVGIQSVWFQATRLVHHADSTSRRILVHFMQPRMIDVGRPRARFRGLNCWISLLQPQHRDGDGQRPIKDARFCTADMSWDCWERSGLDRMWRVSRVGGRGEGA